ncbi:Retrovirus-related Pol polyprotein from transposon 17.6 [Eumeta japonica]|uniref:RNA-directed DNA polymerase n=1 Tax=Eumeta variegata TaxID=151549 RepID=A0A4C1SQL8_EUMVA|nr:Retrovirus-related Pol polyprotein from transposon 17.6 [Eumeta japonica]
MLEEENQQINLTEELAHKDQQLERLRAAYMELQGQIQQQQQMQMQHQQQQPYQQSSQLDRIFKNVSYLPVFTGVGDITINSFLSSVEYLLSSITEEGLMKEATKAIFYRNIQGEAKNVVINIQQPDNWAIIKKTLRLRYRPDTEPHQIYRKINEIRVNNVSELAIELQNIKYKNDELSIYYQDDQYIDLTNVNSLLVNVAKEITQGILLDKIYEERDIGTIIDIMTKRRTTTEEQINAKLYRYPPQHEVEVRRQIKEMEEQGIIRKSYSRYASPLIVVPKKLDNSGERKYRIVVDYRKLNEITIDDKFPLPNIDSILDKLGRAQYFTTLDLAKGYHQILIEEKDREKTAFVTPHGLYEFIRMPFGLKNAPATFQRLMNETLRDYINKTCVVYLDDILIFSTSLTEHVKAVTDIFKALEKANLKIQIDKCNFMKKETEFLGHILTKDGIKPNLNKIKVIQEIALPKTEKQIKSFLGLTGYYRKFVKDYAKVAQPMTKYLKKGVKINDKDPTYIEAFEKLKSLISSHPILRYPDFNKKFTLTTDASNYAIGAVLSQEGHPVCYISRTLNNHEKNYAATDKEFLAIIWSVNYLRPYLYGRKFKILTDHQPIKFLNSKYNGKDMSPRHQRWLLKLGEYDFEIDYIKGKENR